MLFHRPPRFVFSTLQRHLTGLGRLPDSSPTASCWSLGITAQYASQKSEWRLARLSRRRAPRAAHDGTARHNRLHVLVLRSPATNATTCRVTAHEAIHTQHLFFFEYTNDHNSSHPARAHDLLALVGSACRSVWGELELFLIQPVTVWRLTPKVRVRPRRLERSCPASRIRCFSWSL